MPEPIEYQIVKNLQAALLAITVASGYHYNLAALAVKLDPDQDVEALLGATAKRPFIVVELAPDAFAYTPAMLANITLPCTLHGIQDFDVTNDDSFLLTYLRLCADMERAVAKDITRGGLAIDTRILTRQFDTYDRGQVWAKVTTEIRVRRSYGAPDA